VCSTLSYTEPHWLRLHRQANSDILSFYLITSDLFQNWSKLVCLCKRSHSPLPNFGTLAIMFNMVGWGSWDCLCLWRWACPVCGKWPTG
jgi:hypothetical protein